MAEDVTDLVQRQYGRQADFYARSVVHATGETLGLLLDWGSPAHGQRVLDIATGAGFTAFTFAPHVKSVVAYDLTVEMLAQARNLGAQRNLRNLSFIQGMAESLPFPDESFHIVACRTAPHHFLSVQRFLEEASRVVAPGGLVLMADTSVPEDTEVALWQNRVEKTRDPSHVRAYSLSEWSGFFREAGLSVEETSTAYRTPLQFSDWVQRSGTAPGDVAELRRLFSGPIPGAVEAFEIRSEGGEFFFSWQVVAVKGRKGSR